MKKLAALVVTGVLIAAAAPAAQADVVQPEVSIRASLDLPYQSPGSGAKVFQVLGTTVGGGAELSPSDVIASTASRWGGDIQVDLDPSSRTLNVTTPDTNSFETVSVRVSSAQLRLWTKTADTVVTLDGAPRPVTVKTVNADTFELRWDTRLAPVSTNYLSTTGGVTTFRYRNTSTLSARATGSKGKVKFAPRLSVFGLAAPTTSAKVYEGSKFRGTVSLKNGAGAKTISAKKGKHTYKLVFAGTSTAAPTSARATVTVR